MANLSTNANRFRTMQDAVAALFDLASQGSNTSVNPTEVLNDLVTVAETAHTSDGTPAASVAANATWDNGTWGFWQWS